MNGLVSIILNFIYDKRVLLFYGTIVLLLFLNRKKFDVQAKIIFMYRTKFGLNMINKFSSRYKELIKLLGYIGIGVGFVGLLFISGIMLKSLFDFFFNPSLPPAVQPVIPGVNIPGSTFDIPLVMPWIALFVIILVHEFSHGIVAKAHGLKVKNTGIVFFGPLMGAFVEPDEKELQKKSDVIQYSIFAAGPFSNVILAGIIVVIMMFGLGPLTDSLVYPDGVMFGDIINGTPAYDVGLDTSTVYDSINGVEFNDSKQFIKELDKYGPTDNVILAGEGLSYNIKLEENPDDPSKGYLGVLGINNNFKQKYDGKFFVYLYQFLKLLSEQFFWIYLFSLGIGLANLLPLGPVDGGRMLQTACRKVSGNNKKGDNIWGKISYIFLLILLFLVFVPIIKSLFGF